MSILTEHEAPSMETHQDESNLKPSGILTPTWIRRGAITLILASMVLMAFGYSHYRPSFTQLGIHGIVASLCLLTPAGTKWLLEAGVQRYGVLAVLVLISFIAQYKRFDREYFPFVQWHMYSSIKEQATLTHYRITATLEDGQQTVLNLDRLFTGLGEGARRFSSRFENSIKDVDQAGLDEIEPQKVEVLQELLGAFARVYERRTGKRVLRLEVESTSVAVGPRSTAPDYKATPWHWTNPQEP